MLRSCFIHLPGIGPAFETRLRQAGVATWDDALRLPLPCGDARAALLREEVLESVRRLEAGDALWFGSKLPPAGQWRLFSHFRARAAYVDIETTGFDGNITTVALYDGQRVRTYVQGVNLEAFADDILEHTLLVTWNGRGFDAPILRRELHIPLDMAHLDLLPVFRALGLKGGLKRVERTLGLDRGDLDGVDGWAAVRLWHAYERGKDPAVLETLLAYNTADVLSLEFLAAYALARHGYGTMDGLFPVAEEKNPFTPCPRVLRQVLGLRC